MKRFAVCLLAALLAACGSGSKVVPDPPTGERDLVLRIRSLPGMMAGHEALEFPAISIYGGGLAIVRTTHGLTERRLTPAGVKKVSQAAADAGLIGKADPGKPAGPDSGATHFVVVSGGQRHVNMVQSPTGKVLELVNNLHNLDRFLGADLAKESVPYRHDKLAVYAQPTEEPAARAWVLPDLATAGEPYAPMLARCQVLTGDALQRFGQTENNKVWESAQKHYLVIFRPLLPDEDACPALEPAANS